MSRLIAQLQNKAVPALADLQGSDSGATGANILARYIALTIQTGIVLGGLALLLYMFMGAIEWITAGGDSGKIEKARGRILQGVIGMGVLVSVVAIAGFLSPLFGFNLLQPVFINQLESVTGPRMGTSTGSFTRTP